MHTFGPVQVNGWHWVEKDAMPWAQAKAKELFVGMQLIQEPETSLKITGVASLTGEAIINNRKQKIVSEGQ